MFESYELLLAELCQAGLGSEEYSSRLVAVHQVPTVPDVHTRAVGDLAQGDLTPRRDTVYTGPAGCSTRGRSAQVPWLQVDRYYRLMLLIHQELCINS